MKNNDNPNIPDIPTPMDADMKANEITPDIPEVLETPILPETPVVPMTTEIPASPIIAETPNIPTEYAAPVAPTEYAVPTGYGQPVPPEGRRRGAGKPLIIIAIVAILALAFFLFLGPIRTAMVRSQLKKDPQAAITKAFEKSRENIKESSFAGPNFTQFQGQPTEQKVSLGLGSLIGALGDNNLGDMTLEYSLKHHPKKEEMMNTFSFNSPYFVLKESEVYISPKEIQFSVPMVYSEHEYVSIDPETFVEDWNKSEFSSDSSRIDEDFDLPALLHQLFGSTTPSTEKSSELSAVTEEIELFSSTFVDNLEYAYLGETDQVFELGATAKKQDIKNAISDVANLLQRYASENISTSYFARDNYNLLTDFVDSLRELVVIEDAYFILSVDKKSLHVSRIQLESSSFSTMASQDDEWVNFTFDLFLQGEKSLIDDLTWTIDMTVVDNYSDVMEEETATINLTHKAKEERGVVTSVWDARMLVDDIAYTVYSDFNWDKTLKEGENMTWELGIKSRESYFSGGTVLFDGRLEESKDDIFLSDAQITFIGDSEDGVSIDLDYSMEIIGNKSIFPQSKDFIDFFDVNWGLISERLSDIF